MIELDPKIIPGDLKKYFRPKRKYGPWILRNEIIWHKPNAMPSSVKDRFTVDFEKIFFFVKNKKYWFETQYEQFESNKYDRKRMANARIEYGGKWAQESGGAIKTQRAFVAGNKNGRNKRCVWKIITKPFPEAHFAVYPPGLIEIPVKAGCPEMICKKCGTARKKLFDKKIKYRIYRHPAGKQFNTYSTNAPRWESEIKFAGYTDCGCNAGWDKGIVLDPFMGSGTTALVARQLGRSFIGIELNPDYIKIANDRLRQESSSNVLQ